MKQKKGKKMRDWWKRNTVTKEQREQMIMDLVIYFTIIALGLAAIGLFIICLVEHTGITLYITTIIAGAVTGNILIERWVKKGK